MKKILFSALAAAALLSSCNVKDEWTPVFTGKYGEPAEFEPVHMKSNITIQDLCKLYQTGSPKSMTGGYVIEGKVISTDQPGNFYKSFYIQDETAGIEIKVGRNSLYSDYHEGQTVYVACNGLWLGMYGYKDGSYGGQGMVQIGAQDVSGQYETSYIESPLLIDTHIYQGELGNPVEPVVLSESELPSTAQSQAQNKNVGRLVTLKGLTYGAQAFALLYPDPNRPHTSNDPENRLFLTDGTWNITTWAFSKSKCVEHLLAGDWDTAEIGSGNTKFGAITNEVSENGMFASELHAAKAEGKTLTYKDLLVKNAAAQSVSQYFTTAGGKEIQLRTSGFSKFGDYEIPQDVLDGSRQVNITGVLCMYQGSIQMVVNRVTDITYADGTPLYN